MKRLFLILLAAVMVLSLAACGEDSKTPSGGTSTPAEGYDKEFTILVGGSDEWTPFSGKSGVTFVNPEGNVISIADDGKTVKFTGLSVGESVITATLDGAKKTALVRVRAAKADNTINVAFNYIDGDGHGVAEKQILIGIDPSVSLGFWDVEITDSEGNVFDSDFIVQQVDWSAENTHTIALSKSVTEPITVTVTLKKTGYTFTPASREITIVPRTDLD